MSMSQVALKTVKQVINKTSKLLLKVTPKRRPKKPVSRMVFRLFRLLEKAAEMHPAWFYPDKNFPRLLQAGSRVLVFIIGEDTHYAGWMAELFLLIHDIVSESRKFFPAGSRGDKEWIEWAAAQKVMKVKPYVG